MSRPTVFLHIGTNKTGTSAIQRFFNGNRERLAEYGLLYPTTGCMGEAHYGISTALNFTHQRASDESEACVERARLRNDLHAEIEAANAKRVLISSENFVLHHDVKTVRDFLSPCDVFVVLYLRRHDSWWESAYAQAVKMVVDPPWQRGFESFLKFQKEKNPKYGNYRFLVDRWASVFGKERIVVRPYEAAQNKPNLVMDFLGTIGLANEAKILRPKNERVNEAATYQALNLLEFYQRIDVEPETRKRLVKHALSLPLKNGGGHVADPALRRRLIEENLNDYAYIAKKYLGRKDGKLFTEPLPEPDCRWTPARRLSYLRVIEETAKALQ